MFNLFLFLIGLIPLIYFSYQDLRFNQINNIPILIFSILSLVCLFFCNQIIQLIIILILNFGIFYFLWTKNSIGGADVKLITPILIFILVGSPNIIVAYLFFIVILLFVGTIYYLFCKLLLKNKEVPFILLFTLIFIIFSLLKLVWK